MGLRETLYRSVSREARRIDRAARANGGRSASGLFQSLAKHVGPQKKLGETESAPSRLPQGADCGPFEWAELLDRVAQTPVGGRLEILHQGWFPLSSLGCLTVGLLGPKALF